MRMDKRMTSNKHVKEIKKQFDHNRIIKTKAVIEKLSNENLFKNDIKYQMNRSLKFESIIDEENAHKDLLDRFQTFCKYFLPILLCQFLILSCKNFFYILLTIISLLIYSFISLLVWTKENKDKVANIPQLVFISNSSATTNCNVGGLIRLLIEILFCLNLIFKADFSGEFTVQSVGYIFLPMFITNLVLDTSMSLLMFVDILEISIILCLQDHPDNNFIARFFSNVFSTKIFVVLFTIFIGIANSYFLKKGLRELWALFESFKRSFHIVKKCMFDEFPYPVFIIAKKTNNPIFYKNTKAEELMKHVKELKMLKSVESTAKKSSMSQPQSQKPTFRRIQAGKTGTMSGVKKDDLLEEVFLEKEVENIFLSELEKCVANKKKFFDFPLNINDKKSKKINFHQNTKKVTFFEGDLEDYDWYRMAVSHCFWKNQESYYVQMIKNDNFYLSNFISDYKSNISQEFNTTIENVDRICDKITEGDSQSSKSLALNNTGSNTLGPMKTKENFTFGFPVKSSPVEVTTPEVNVGASGTSLPNKKAIKRTMTFANNQPQQQQPQQPQQQQKTNTNTSQFFNSFLGTPRLLSNVPQYDHSVWFFLKYQSNFINDMHVTVKVYNSLMNRRLHSYNYRINIRELFNYLYDYFLIPCRIKNFKLLFNNHSNEEELVVNYQYFRTVMFNVLLFIINNSNDSSKEKVVEINVRSEKDISNEEFIIKFSIKFKDDKPKLNLNNVYEIIKNRTKGNVNNKKNLDKIKVVDIGMITVYYILNQVYENDIVMQSDADNHSLSFSLKGKFQRESKSGDEIFPILKFRDPKIKITEQYYNKILQKVFKIFPPVISKIYDVRGILNKIENNKELKKGFPSFKGSESDKTLGVEIDNVSEKLLPEELNVKIEKDKITTREMNICLSKHFDNYDKLLYEQIDKKEKIKIIMEKSKKLKFLPEEERKTKVMNKIKFDEDSKSKVKYFYPPRFLIVEDNAFGRINLIDILKKQKLDYLIDIAAYGRESIQKFKFFLNRGFIYDIIFMDIHLLDIMGSDAARVMREYEKEHPDTHTNIVAVSVEGKKNVMNDNIFDNYFEKPIKAEEFVEYIFKHLSRNRPEIKL